MRPGVVHVKTRIVSAGVMTNPDLAIDMWRIGVAFFIAEVSIWLDGVWCALQSSGPVRWRSLMPPTRFIVLGKRWDRKNEQCGQCELNGFHVFLRMP
jgi:hypothetical protein